MLWPDGSTRACGNPAADAHQRLRRLAKNGEPAGRRLSRYPAALVVPGQFGSAIRAVRNPPTCTPPGWKPEKFGRATDCPDEVHDDGGLNQWPEANLQVSAPLVDESVGTPGSVSAVA
jgi:hypothetical protein